MAVLLTRQVVAVLMQEKSITHVPLCSKTRALRSSHWGAGEEIVLPLLCSSRVPEVSNLAS